ncbi:hypothetical protein [Snuella sedimenti]|uniref:Uncharacterized protein n=1 Tax=Snuella sedimenti TaxID=2798802 RepID=A0A8J7IEW2_9FLAO|nr:hypothetical protein [Snuella sedimenti]MBJ6367022.1 hypothetical protein [Snuella sedimenti]
MNQNLENKLIKTIEEDVWMIDILKTVRIIKLKDCWAGTYFVKKQPHPL